MTLEADRAQIEALRQSLLETRAENARLQAALSEALEQQTATSEILRVISRSPNDLQPVAQAIADCASRLCDCAYVGVFRFDGRLDYGAIGTVTNLAARLCGEAAAGQILVSARVAGAVEHLVAADDVGPVTLKGLARPVPIWSVRGLR